MLKIGELSRICQVPVKTLRFYDEEGLLPAARVDPYTGYRFYAASQIGRFHRILALKELGFSLEEIRRQLDAESEETTDALLREKEQDLVAQRRRIDRQLARLGDLRETMKRSSTTEAVVIRPAEPMTLAGCRGLFADRGEALIRAADFRRGGEPLALINEEVEYTDGPLDMRAGVWLPGTSGSTRSGEETAALVCRRDGIEQAYGTLTAYLERNRYQIVGPTAELYYEEDVVELRVAVCTLSEETVPLEKEPFDGQDVGFENDERLLGRWEFVDCLPSKEQFCPARIKNTAPPWLKEFVALPDGEGYWIFDGWSKGIIRTCTGWEHRRLNHQYEIEERDGESYLFLSMVTPEYADYGGRPVIWVFRKRESRAFTREELRHTDPVDRRFVPDERVVGRWVSCDCVKEPDLFDPGCPSVSEERLFVEAMEFESGGKCTRTYRREKDPIHCLTWSLGTVLDRINRLAEAYEIRAIDKRDFLFVEWKTGDYIYAGRHPVYYVFRRAQG